MGAIFHNPYAGQTQVWTPHTASIIITGVSSGTERTADFLGAVTGLSIQFQRNQATHYPIGQQQAPIKLVGIPQGTVTLDSIIGPTTDLSNFLKKFGDSCQTFTMQLKTNSRKGSPSCAKKIQTQTIKLTQCIGTMLTYTLRQAQGGLSQASGQFRISFTGMQWN